VVLKAWMHTTCFLPDFLAREDNSFNNLVLQACSYFSTNRGFLSISCGYLVDISWISRCRMLPLILSSLIGSENLFPQVTIRGVGSTSRGYVGYPSWRGQSGLSRRAAQIIERFLMHQASYKRLSSIHAP